MTMKGDGFTTYLLNMTSQRWLTDKDVDRSIWWHYLAVVVPDKLQYTDKAGLYITGNYNTDAPPNMGSEDLELVAALALTTGSVCAALFQVPNAPIYFHAEQPPRGRVEDEIIAYTWNHFLENPDEPEWLPFLPMTKVRRKAG
jgi:PhoPQ-activated pathogenicity-related protein